MSSLSGIVGETARKAERTAAVAAADPSAEAAAQQTVTDEHFCRAIMRWAALTQTDSEATEDTFKFKESLVTASVITTWDTELTTAGYVVTRADDMFTVALT